MNNPDLRIVLVGLMGTGKSTVAWLLSQHFKVPCLDTDKLIELRIGKSVREIFTDSGEEFFREVESEVLLECLHTPGGAIIAAAGGVILGESNRAAIKQAATKRQATVVWLFAEPESLVARTAKGSHRPALDDDRLGVLEQMFAQREGLYKEVSDVIIDVSQRTAESVADLIIDAINEAVIWDNDEDV